MATSLLPMEYKYKFTLVGRKNDSARKNKSDDMVFRASKDFDAVAEAAQFSELVVQI